MLPAVFLPIGGIGRGPLEAPITAQAQSMLPFPTSPRLYNSEMDLAGDVKIADFSLHSCQKKKEKKTATLLLLLFIEAPVSSADMSPSQQKQKSPVSQDIKRAHFIATRSLAHRVLQKL